MEFLLIFIPLFVAIDPIGTMPLFIAMTDGFTKREKVKLAFQAVLTALIVGIIFGIGGTYIFSLLGITTADFQIAGGILLLIFSVKEIFGSTAKRSDAPALDELAGVVPLGIPLIAGPAMITTLLILFDAHTYLITMLALVLNLAITLALFLSAEVIMHRIGEAASRALAKVIGIFLAAIAIMMIRKGIFSLIGAD